MKAYNTGEKNKAKTLNWYINSYLLNFLIFIRFLTLSKVVCIECPNCTKISFNFFSSQTLLAEICKRLLLKRDRSRQSRRVNSKSKNILCYNGEDGI